VNTRAHGAALRALFVVGGSVVGFALLQGWFRRIECRLANLTLDLLPGQAHTRLSTEASIIVFPLHDSPFRAIVTPACSSLASVLAIGCLASVAMPRSRRRVVACVAATAVVVIGNVLRIALSTGAGIVAGRASLVLFHDWVGGVMTLVYTVGGYVLLLWLLLPAGGAGSALAPAVADLERADPAPVGETR
jgi:exosortase/archaeosortase family protein